MKCLDKECDGNCFQYTDEYEKIVVCNKCNKIWDTYEGESNAN